MTTLLALYRRPDGGDDALAEFERRYLAEHIPLVAADARDCGRPTSSGSRARSRARRTSCS